MADFERVDMIVQMCQEKPIDAYFKERPFTSTVRSARLPGGTRVDSAPFRSRKYKRQCADRQQMYLFCIKNT